MPVLGVVGWAGSFGDGIHKSIPAPGMGALAAACGGERSPLGEALEHFGLTADDVAVVYKHDTSTAANDPNENALHNHIQRALGRSEGNPLWVVSQKSLTGHPKGGAAAWQTIGLCQAMASGRIPGNRNLDSVDEAMRVYEHLGFTDRSMDTPLPLRAGLVTSLGFGHVSAIALILHPQAFIDLIPEEKRQAWMASANSRLERQKRFWPEVAMGKRAAYEKRAHRRFDAPDGSVCQANEEAKMLLNPDARLDLSTGIFTP
jgi:fatty acid synthase